MSLVVVGSVAFDAIETPFGQTDKIIGGAGTYISLASSFFGNQPKIVSVVGGDFPESYLELLSNYKIDTDGLQVKADEKTFFWSGRYHTNMNERDTLATELNVLADFDPQLPSHYRSAEFLMLGNLSPVVQRQVIEQLPQRPKLIVMDTMNFWMDSCWDELLKTISMVDVLAINDSEARQLSGEYSLPKAAKKIMEMGPQYLIIKKGEHGALLFHGEETFYAPALPLEEVFDPTGAGDTFAGGFIGYMAQCKEVNFENMKKALIAGSAMASFCVEEFGTKKLLDLNQELINERLQKFVDLTQFNPEFMN